jgi:ubiquinone/menaquinone biosynthesis C-methylase UbiE
LGNIRNKSVLDLACGDGHFSRLFAEWGAKKVVGVDQSSEMIKIALNKESEKNQGIQYLVADVAQMASLGQFDLVFAGFLLHYADNKEVLHAMAKKIAAHLKKGQRFVSFNENPFHPIYEGIKYDVESVASLPLTDGSIITKIHYKNGVKDFEFSHRHYHPKTYQDALESAGFENIKWNQFIKSEDKNDKRPPHYWDDYLNDFSISVLTCSRS